jgi:hypothetical protein
MTTTFSERYGYSGPAKEILVREDAPDSLRVAVAQIAIDVGLFPKQVRKVVCGVLYVRPDPNNWSDHPNVWDELQGHLDACPWFKVYDIAEEFYDELRKFPGWAEKYRSKLNRFFVEQGIGWQLDEDGKITYRGSEAFAAATSEASNVLRETGRNNAANEIHEALRDISRRPNPDVTGAIQHAIAALESTARDVTGLPKPTLGQLVQRLDLPKPLDGAVEKLWGFASERARHMREGDKVDDAEAQLTVIVACALCTFLAKRK